MKPQSHLFRASVVVLLTISAGGAAEGTGSPKPQYDRDPSTASSAEWHVTARTDEPKHQVVQPLVGRGYVPYSYPAVGTCPCAGDECFNAACYYCGGKPYRKAWRKKWLRAHFGHGSMLDGHPCECLFPTVGRPYWQPAAAPAKPPVEDDGFATPNSAVPER